MRLKKLFGLSTKLQHELLLFHLLYFLVSYSEKQID